MDDTIKEMLILVLGCIIAALQLRMGQHVKRGVKEATEVNDAVNHTHPNEDGQIRPRIYDIALNNQLQLKDLATDVKSVVTKVDDLSNKLDDHLKSSEPVTQEQPNP